MGERASADPTCPGPAGATVLVAAPGITGVIATVEARLQGRRGPRLLQPYSDLGKLFGKEALAPEGRRPVLPARAAGGVRLFPDGAAADPGADQLSRCRSATWATSSAGASFSRWPVSWSRSRRPRPVACTRSSGRAGAKTFAAITEPVVLLVVFTVALVTTTDLPYVLGAAIRSGAGPDRPAGAPAGVRGAVHGDPVRDRPDPGRDAHRHRSSSG